MVFRITMITIVNTDTRTQQAINGEYKIYFKGLTFDWKLGYCYNKQFLSYLEKQDSFLLNGGADSAASPKWERPSREHSLTL